MLLEFSRAAALQQVIQQAQFMPRILLAVSALQAAIISCCRPIKRVRRTRVTTIMGNRTGSRHCAAVVWIGNGGIDLFTDIDRIVAHVRPSHQGTRQYVGAVMGRAIAAYASC